MMTWADRNACMGEHKGGELREGFERVMSKPPETTHFPCQ